MRMARSSASWSDRSCSGRVAAIGTSVGGCRTIRMNRRGSAGSLTARRSHGERPAASVRGASVRGRRDARSRLRLPNGGNGDMSLHVVRELPTRPELDRRFLEERLIPALRALIRLGYFGLELEGVEHLPRDGRAVFAANHAGWFPLDAFFLGLAAREALGPESAPL